MIALTKLKISASTQATIEWNIQRYAQHVIAGEPVPDALQSAYNNVEIKAKLKEETNEKCAYCESRMLRVDYGDIEHITPKGRNPRLRFDYSNLTLSCGVCNTKKAEFEDILNPYSTDPSEHLFACGPMIFRRSNSDVGLITERRLDLNRIHLLERRAERLRAIAILADQIARTSDGSIRTVLVQELKSEALKTTEYSMVSQAFVEQVCVGLGI